MYTMVVHACRLEGCKHKTNRYICTELTRNILPLLSCFMVVLRVDRKIGECLGLTETSCSAPPNKAMIIPLMSVVSSLFTCIKKVCRVQNRTTNLHISSRKYQGVHCIFGLKFVLKIIKIIMVKFYAIMISNFHVYYGCACL